MDGFTPVQSLLGGVLIALGLGGMLLGYGRVSGISGVLAGVVRHERGDTAWRLFFVAGVVLAGLVATLVAPSLFDRGAQRAWPLLIGAGLLVGVGTRLANGCTSGHGVAGNARLSRRSIVATLTFMAVGSATAIAAARLGVH